MWFCGETAIFNLRHILRIRLRLKTKWTLVTSNRVSRVGLETAVFFETPEQICSRVFKQLRPRTPVAAIEVRFCKFANVNSFIRMESNRIEIRISDLLQNAPASIIEALAYILIGKLFRKEIPAEYSQRYRRYLNRRDVRSAMEATRQVRGRKLITSAEGHVYNLATIFDELNFKYFFGLMAAPTIGWSRRASRGTLGHYDPSHHAIVLSKSLDRSNIPRVVVEYVMFHEMLHLRYPARHTGLRRCVHTREFKEAEKQFERLAEAKALIKNLPVD